MQTGSRYGGARQDGQWGGQVSLSDNVEKVRLVAKILRRVYADPASRAEVNAAIATGIYKDEQVNLKDLLKPTTSQVYKHSKFDLLKAQSNGVITPGRFASQFMREATGLKATANGRVSEDYFTDSGIAIYFPYSDNFGGSNEPIAVVDADQEADGKWVQDPRCDDTQEGYPFETISQ